MAGTAHHPVNPDLVFTDLAGSRDAPALLVVGPSLGTSVTALWAECATLLGDGFQVIGWDLPGHGRGTLATRPFTVAGLTDAVREHASRSARGRPATHAGVSMGGAVSFELATRPGPFDRVAAIASAPRIGEAAAWRERADLVHRAGTAALIDSSSARWFAPGFAERDPQTSGALLTALADADPGSYALACGALARFDAAAAVRAAEVPVLVAAGEHDPVIAPEHAALVAGTIPRGEYALLEGCGHLPPAEVPAAVAARLRRFMTTDQRQGDTADDR